MLNPAKGHAFGTNELRSAMGKGEITCRLTEQLTILSGRPTRAPEFFKIDCLQIAYRRIIVSRIANHK